MKTIIYLTLLASLSVGLNSCDSIFNSDDEALAQEFYFQYEYLNHAWGYSHSGWLIDSLGNVWCYTLPENWNQSDSSGMIDAAALKANLSKTDSVCHSIDMAVLKKKIKLIENASSGTLQDPESVGADMGAMSYYAFVYEKKKDSYKRILLKKMGDWTIDNDAREADDLYEWMVEIQEGM